MNIKQLKEMIEDLPDDMEMEAISAPRTYRFIALSIKRDKNMALFHLAI